MEFAYFMFNIIFLMKIWTKKNYKFFNVTKLLGDYNFAHRSGKVTFKKVIILRLFYFSTISLVFTIIWIKVHQSLSIPLDPCISYNFSTFPSSKIENEFYDLKKKQEKVGLCPVTGEGVIAHFLVPLLR